jgi:DNA-directed RNA polymerase II subunit RPB2
MDPSEKDKNIWNIIESYIQENPQYLVKHHIESYNDFFQNGIFQIFRDKNPLSLYSDYDSVNNIYTNQCHFYFGGKTGKRIYFGKPTINDNGNVHYMYPNEARLRDMNYSMTIHYDIEIEYLQYVGEQDENNVEDYVDEDDDEKRQKKEKTREQKYQMMTGKSGKYHKFIIQEPLQVLPMIYLGKFPIMVQSDFCILNKLPREVRFSLGECRNEQGGYFIIGGKEKVIISQEKFADNILYIRESPDDHYSYSAEIRSVSENVSKPIRTLSVQIQKSTNKYSFENIVVNIPNITKPVPLFIVFRALGVLSDKEIISTCLLDLDKYGNMIDLFRPSVYDAGNIYSQNQALHFISQLLIKNKTFEKTLEILADYFLPHIGELNFKEKAFYLGYMVFHLLCVKIGSETPTNRDNFKYKRIETTGSLISDLFREYYNKQINIIHHLFEEQYKAYHKNLYGKDLRTLVNDRYESIFYENRILEDGFNKAFKGNWGSQTHTKRVGIVQDLNRLSFNSAMSHLRKTNVPIDASMKLVGPRLLHNTQWGYLDPIDTPDGAHIGIQKNLSLFTTITKGQSREPVIEWLRINVDMRLLADCTIEMLASMTKVFVNGTWAGSVKKPMEALEKMKLFRRNGLIPIYISVSFDIKQDTIFIYTDAGRLTRPIFYIESDGQKLSFSRYDPSLKWEQLVSGIEQKKIPYKTTEFYTWKDLYDSSDKDTEFVEKNKAIIDYIDTSETETSLICIDSSKWNPQEHYTHCEIHESLVYGAMFQMITFPEHNPQQRDLFSCGQSKQAVSLYHTNFQNRMDKNGVVLNAVQIPLVKSRFLQYITGEENLYGQNTIVAIMSYTGYNVEDSILFNEASLSRGLFRTSYYNTYSTFEEKSKVSDKTIEKTFTNILNDSRVIGIKPGYDYSQLDEYGIIKENTPVDDKLIMIGLTSNDLNNPDKRIDASVSCKKGQVGVVDKTFITEGEEGHRIAKVRIREDRIPALGDKMASRAGQKGTIGLILPERDMPFTKDGLRPDIIINPHAIPTRMTIGQFLESILAKGAVVYGSFGDCTAFNQESSQKVKYYGELLNKMGYHSSGNEIMYNGFTGEQLETNIFLGPTYYMRLKHMVKDKINYRALGPNAALTRQPVSGRANDGGLRIGEMERDSMAGHGISHFLKESMMERADKYFMAVCNQTGLTAIYNPSKNLFMSPLSDGPLSFNLSGNEIRLEKITKFGREFSIIAIPYSMKLFLQELQAMNIQMRIITDDNIRQIEGFLPKVEPKKIGGEPVSESKQEELEEDEEKKDEKDEEEPKEIDIHLPENDEEEPKEIDIHLPENDEEFQIKGINEFDVEEDDQGQALDDKTNNIPFEIGEEVYIRGTTNKPERIWNVKSIGNKFVTIETQDMEGLGSSEAIKVISPLYLIPASGYSPFGLGQIPLVQNMEQQQQQQQQQQQHQQQQQMPYSSPTSINIKLVNGPDQSVVEEPARTTDNNKQETTSSVSKKEDDEKPDDNTIDFSKKLLIKKI